MGASTPAFSKTFVAALKQMGGPRLNLEQVLRAYQIAFPTEAMQPDIRERLFDAIIALSDAGILTIPDGNTGVYQNQKLPKSIEMIYEEELISEDPKTFH